MNESKDSILKRRELGPIPEYLTKTIAWSKDKMLEVNKAMSKIKENKTVPTEVGPDVEPVEFNYMTISQENNEFTKFSTEDRLYKLSAEQIKVMKGLALDDYNKARKTYIEQASDDVVEEFKRANETVKRLKDHPKVLEWIEVEGRRKVEEYIDKKVIEYKARFPLITDEDILWIRNCNDNYDRELQLVLKEPAHNEEDVVVVEVIRTLRNSKIVRDNKLTTILTRANLLPLSMTHLWGNGYIGMI